MVSTTQTTDLPKRKRPRRKITAPDIGSLYDILHDHAGIALFSMPISWTDLHAQALGCKFVQLPTQREPKPSFSLSPRRQPRTPPVVLELRHQLNILTAGTQDVLPLQKNHVVRDLMLTLFPRHLARASFKHDVPLRFGDRCHQATRCQVIWRGPEPHCLDRSYDSASTLPLSEVLSTSMSPPSPPILVFLNRSNLNYIRNHCFRVIPGPNGTINHPVRRLQELRSKNLMPSNPDEDQYITALMIGLAQEAAYTDVRKPGARFHPRDIPIKVMTISEEEESFIVYSSTVPSSLLSMFHEPAKAPRSPSQLQIQYTKVPIWPILGFKERLGLAVGKDVVGGFDEINIETFEEDLAVVSPKTPSPKREREPMAEVFNASFSEDRDPDYGRPALKRRCLEEGRVGVVR